MFLESKTSSRACLLYDPSHFVLQCLDYKAYIDHYHERIKMFHGEDAGLIPPVNKAYMALSGWVEERADSVH